METELVSELQILKSVRLFQGLSQPDLQQALAYAQRKTVAADEFLFFQEDPAEKIYTLLEGRLKLVQVTPEGQQVIIHYVTPAEAFAVIAVLTGSQYPVSAQAVDRSHLLAWDRATMQRLMQESPALALNTISILVTRIKEFQDRIRELSTERVERRIARALLRLARQAGQKTPEGILINLPITRQDLAEMTGTTLFTVSRMLSQWEAKGIVQAGRERVVIRYPHGLVSIAEDLPFDPNEQKMMD